MQTLKRFNPLISLIMLVIGLLGCFLFYLSTNSNSIQENNKSWLLKTQSNKGHEELENVLKRASMSDRTVILTTLNEAWAGPGSIIDLFLESFHIGIGTKRLLNHLVIVEMDQKTLNRCKSIHPHCYSLSTPGVNFTSEKRFMTPDYLKLMWRRIEFLQIVLELGYNFLFTDADVMWLRDPFPKFPSLDEITIACDVYTGNPTDRNNRANAGFIYVKSIDGTIDFYKYWYMARYLHPESHDQSVFEIIKHEKIIRMMGIRINYLDTTYFGGFCQPSTDMNKVCTMHANCCVGIERKLHDLRLVLDDWKNFTRLSPKQKKLRHYSPPRSPWRAPSKCKWW